MKSLIKVLLISLLIFIVYQCPVLAADSSTELIVTLEQSKDPIKIQFTDGTDLDSVAQAYKKRSEVRIAEPNKRYEIALEPLDTFFTSQAYLTQIQANRAWNDIRESPDIVIAIIDTGVDIDNPDLISNIWQNKQEFPGNGIDDDGNGYIDDIHGWDFVTDTPDVKPKFDPGFTKIAMNHGTLVAGVAAAQGGNSIGVAGLTWHAQIMPLRVLDGTGAGDTLSVTKAINYAREMGADIINLSFIGNEASETLNLAIEQAYHEGIFIVAAAGNELSIGEDMDLNPKYPVCHDGPSGQNRVIGVAAVDMNDRRASFSNYGHDCIDVSAPGLRIFSTQFTSLEHEGFEQEYGGYWTGTSVAAPQVSGLAALVKALNPKISLSEWQRLIIDNTDDISEANRNTSWSGKLGSGRINAFKTIAAAKTFSPGIIHEIDNFVVTGAGIGGGPHVRLFDLSGEVQLQFFAYNVDFDGGINATVADLNNDGYMEIITTPQSKYGPEVKIFDRFGSQMNSFFAYDDSYTEGLNAIPADINGDGDIEIVTAPNSGKPLIRIFNQKGEILEQFFAYNQLFEGGISLAIADVDLDGIDDIITVPRKNAPPILRIFNPVGTIKNQFMAGDPTYLGGLTVGAWRDTIAVGATAGNAPYVSLYNLAGKKIRQWLAYDKGFLGGLTVQLGDLNEDDKLDIITGPSQGGGPHLRIFDENGNVLTQWMAYNPAFRGGISVHLTSTN